MPKVSVLGDQAPAPSAAPAAKSTKIAKSTGTTGKTLSKNQTAASQKIQKTTPEKPSGMPTSAYAAQRAAQSGKTYTSPVTKPLPSITSTPEITKPVSEVTSTPEITKPIGMPTSAYAAQQAARQAAQEGKTYTSPVTQPMIGQHQQTIRESQEFAQQKARDQRTKELFGPDASNRSVVSLYSEAAGGEGFHNSESMRAMREQIDTMWAEQVQPAWDKYQKAQEDYQAGKTGIDEVQKAFNDYQRVFYQYDPLQKAFETVQRSAGVGLHSGDSYEALLSVSERWDAAINASEQNLKALGEQLDKLDQNYNDAVAAYEKNKTQENAQRVNAIVNNLNRLSGEYQAAAFVFNEMAGNAESLDNMADAALHRDHPEVFWLPNVGETRTNAKGETEIHYTASYDEVEDRIHDLERQAAEATSSAEKEIILREAKWYQGILSTGAIFQDMVGTELQENRDRLSSQVEDYNTTLRRLQWDMDELAFNGMTDTPEYQALLDQYKETESARADLQFQVNVIDRHMDQNAHQEVLDDLTRGTQNEFDKFVDLAAAWGDMSSYIRGDMPSDYQLNVEMSAPELVKLSEDLRDDLMEEGLTADQAQSMMLYATREANFKRTAELRKATIDKAGDTGWLLNWLSAGANSLASGLGYLDLAWQGMNGYKDAYTGKSTIDYNTESQDFYTRQNAYAEEQFSRYYNRMLAKNDNDEEIANAKAQARMNWYNLTLSMGQSTAVAGLSMLGVPGALLLLSGSAATQTAQEMHERGYSDGAALTAGALAGFAEYITEKIALDSLLKGFTRAAGAGMTPTQIFQQSMINLGVQGWTEGAEEGLSDIINRFGDELVIRYLNGGVSDIEMKARELQLQGDMSWDEAKSAAEKDWVVTFAKDVWNGALSGIMMGGGGTAIGGISSALGDVATGYRAENNGLTNAVLEQIGSIDRATADLAGMKNDDALKKSNIGSWYQLGHAINNFADVYAVDAINSRLQALGEAEISEDLIRGINAASHGYRLNPLERQAIAESQFGQQVTDELKGFRDAQESYFKKARADRDYSPESYRSFLSTFDGQENSWAAEAERIGRETTMDFSRPADDRDYTSVVDSAYDAQTGSSRLQGDPAQVIQQMLRTGVASESELRSIQQSKELRAEYEKQTGQKLSKNATNARREMRQHLASPNATAEEKAFIRAKNNNPDATVLGPAATALAKAGLTDMNKALSYGKILDAIADGQAVSPFDLRRLDLNNPAVRTVFGERTGMINLPNNITTELKRALVDRAIQEVQKTRQNQEAIAEGAEQLLELQREKAQAELKDAMTKDGQGRLRKTAAKRRAEKSQRKTNIQKAFEERAAAAGRYQRIDVRGKSERQVLTQVQDQANDHSIWSKSAFEQSFREANNIGDRALTSGEMATLDTIYNNYLLAKRLTTQERIALNDAYANAEEAAKELDNQAVEVKEVDPAKRLQRQMKRGAGKVLYESNVDMDKLTEHQRTGLRVLMRLARALGVTFHIYQTEKVNGQGQIWIDKEGRKHSDNGWYDKKTGEIWLDINAGQLGQGTLLFTAAHELTHWMRDWSPARYQVLAKFLLDRYAEHGVKRSKVEKLKVLEYARGNVDLTTEEGAALEEAVADAMETMLTSPDVLQAIDELKAVDASTGNAVVRFLKSFVDTVQKVYSKFRPDSREGRFVASLEKDQLAELQKLFVEGLSEAAEQYQAWDPKVDIDGDPAPQQYSIRSMTEGMGLKFEKTEDGGFQILDQDDKPVKKVTPDQVVNTPLGNLITLALENDNISTKDAGVQYKFLADLMNMIIEYRDAALIWEIAGSQIFSAIRNNSDTQYGLTIDFSTVCKKTQQIVDVMSGAMEKLGRGLTRAEVEMAYRKTQGAGEPVPCPVCYVFSRWMGIGGILNQIAKYQEKYAKMSEEELVKFVLDVEADVNAYAEKTGKSFGKAISAMKSAAESEYKSLDKKLANSIKARLEIAEFEALLANETKKSEQTKLRSKIKARQAKVLSAEEEAEVQRQLTEAENNPEKERLEAYQFLNGTILLYDKKTKTWSKNSEYKPVPASVLFNLNKGADFAANYPFTWKFRTTKGCAAGKAIMPFSDARVGESIQGVAAGTVANIKTDPSLNPFTNGDTKAMQKTLDQARIKARRQNLIGGTRYQSTSDFRYEYGSDYLITFLEMQAMGSKVQLYTKVIEAVDFLATMGADCNLSVMPLNNGYVGDKLVYSSVTGINAEAAIQKAHEYDNVQLILVGISDEHIRLALAGTDVTFVIPFHGSGNTTKQIQTLMNAVNEDLDVTTARDYSTVQTDKVDPNRTAEQEAMWDLRMAIIMGLVQENIPAELEKILSGENEDASEGAKYRQSLHDRFGTDTPERRDLLKKNPFLKDLYDRFYVEGKDADAYQCWLAQDQAEQIFPYEYWDKTLTYDEADQNGDRFRDYCARMGIIPRFTGKTVKGGKVVDAMTTLPDGSKVAFGDFSKDKGYWKLLIDRKMYNNRYDENGNWIGYGIYHEQKPINCTNFDVETIDPKYGSLTYGEFMTPANDRSKTAQIVQTVVDEINGVNPSTQEENQNPSTVGIDTPEQAETMHSIRVTDPATLRFLNEQEKAGDVIHVYKSFAYFNGALYAPMAEMTKDENGKYVLSHGLRLGEWEESEGNPAKIKRNKAGKMDLKVGKNGWEYGVFTLKKTEEEGGGTVDAAYNPYQHASNSVLNDQFEAGYSRPRLVTVECIIPKSELTSGYRAPYAKDPVGIHEWHEGTVAGQLENYKRMVYMSRWLKPVRILGNDEVARMYKEILDNEPKKIKVPFNVVPPALLRELEKLGVAIDYEGSPNWRGNRAKQIPQEVRDSFEEIARQNLINSGRVNKRTGEPTKSVLEKETKAVRDAWMRDNWGPALVHDETDVDGIGHLNANDGSDLKAMYSIRQPIQTAEEAAAMIDQEMGKGTAKKIKQTLRYFEQRAAKAEKQAEQARETLEAKKLLHKQTLKRAKTTISLLQKGTKLQINEINRQKRELQHKLDKVVKDRHKLIQAYDEARATAKQQLREARAEAREQLRETRAEAREQIAQTRAEGEQALTEQRQHYRDLLNYNARTDRQWARGQYLSAVRETKKADRKALREAVRVERQVNSMESHKAAQIKRKFENRAAQVVINHGADLAVPMPFDGKNERAKEAVNFRLAVEEALGKGYRMMVNALQGVDNFAKDQTRTDNASVWVNIVRGSKSMSERFFTEGLLDKAGNVIGPSMSDTLLIKDEKGQVDQTLQEVLNNYMFHLHNTDRMSLEARANAMVDAYVQQHPWLRDMTERDLRQYVHDDNQIVLEYVRLMRWALTINNKEVLAWEDETPVTAEESQRFIDEVKANYPEIVDKANEIYKWWDVFMQEWAVGTSISQEQYNFMREIYPHYVPTFREFGDKKARMLGPTMTADSITGGVVTKKAEGSTRQLLRMEDQYVKSLRQIIRMNRQNAFLQNIIEEFLFDDEGVFAKHGFFDWEGAETGIADNFWEFTKTQNTDSVEKTKDGMYKITCWVNGEKMSAYVNRAMFEGIAFLFDRSPEWVKQFTKIGNKLTGPMKSMITGLNPFFAAKNIIRDQHTALVNSVAGVAFPKYLAQAAAKIATNDEDWIIFQNLGGVSATMHTMEGGFADAMDTGLNQIRNAATWKKPLKAIKAMDTKVQDILGKPGEWSESVTRFAEYLATIDMRGGDTAETRMEGIRNAAEVTVDFGRRGTLGTVLNAWVPYWNPGVQGLDKAIRNVFMQPTVKECMNRAGRAVLVNIIPQALAIALTMALGEWDEYEKLSDQVKDHYYCIPMGWMNPKWKNKFLKIPKSQDWAAFIATPFMRIIEGVNGRDNPFENYYETALDSVLPFQIRDSAFGGKTITLDAIVAGQVADLRSNTNYAGASIVPYALLDASAKEQWDADTSVLAKAIGQIFNKSPMKLDYFLENYMGNFFGTIAAAIPYSPFSPVGYYTGEVDRLDQLNEAIRTVLSPFVADNRYSNHIRASYYEMYNELKQRYTDAGAHGDPKDMEDYEFYKALTMTNGYADQITEMARYVRELPPGEEKDLGYEALAGLSSEALEFYEAYKNGDVKDPVQWMTYNRYGERILKETARLSKYEEDFNFNGMLGNPTTVFDRSGDNDVKFKLDEAQQDIYARFRAGRYQQILNQTISNDEYKNAPNDQVRAQLLEDAKREALRLAESDMISYLNRNGIKGETITKTDYTYVEKQAAYMISRILGDDNAYDKLITDTLIRLYDYGDNYSFNPTDTTNRKTFTSQTREGQVYVLTEDQQHKYSELYHDMLSDYYTKVINSKEFQDAYEEEQAAMLARAKTYATNKVYEDFNTWLERTGAQSETKFRADEVMSLEAKYAVQRALGMDESYPLELTGELIRLYDNKSVGSQSYLPPSYRPTSYSVPGKKGYKWILTADQKDVYEAMARDIYQHDMLEVIRSSAYARADDYDQAQMLCATRDQVTDKARAQFIAWLQQTATPTWTKGPEEQARQQDIKYAERVVDSILG